MILQELKDLADAAGWMEGKEFTDVTVHWLLRIDADGNPIRDAGGNLICWHRLTTDPPAKSKKKPKPGRLFPGAPKINRRNQNDIKADFLVGRADRLLFTTDEDSSAGKTRIETENLLRQIASHTDEPAILAADKFYHRCREQPAVREELLAALIWQLKAEMVADRDETEKEQAAASEATRQVITFSLDTDDYEPAFSKRRAKAEWRDIVRKSLLESSSHVDNQRPCLCCGESCTPLRIHEAKIKGLPGPGRTGVSLIAYNKEAFQSHGLEDSLNAPMCQRCVDAYTVSLDRLIRPSVDATAGPSYGGSRETAGIAFCYWCRNPLDQDPMLLPFEAPVKDVENLFNAAGRGDDTATLSNLEDRFFVLPISAPSKGRAAVHGWITTTLGEVRQNLAAWFEATKIVDPFTGRTAEPVRLTDPPREADKVEKARIYNRHIPSALSRWNREKRHWEIPSSLISAIVRCALEGPTRAPLPLEVLSAALIRLRADVHKRDAGRLPGFTTARVGLMRAVLNQHPELRKGGPIMLGLDRKRDDAAYVCGRLLAVLTRAQAAALRGDGKEQRISASVVSRYYSAASARPSTGLYVPIKMRIAHLNKLDRDAPDLAIRFRKELEEIFGFLGSPNDLPKTLTPAEQCVFAIGFEHQTAELWKGKPKGDGGLLQGEEGSGESTY